MNVLGVSITFIPSVLLCGHTQLDYLAKQGKINYRFIPEHFLTSEVVEWADVIVFIRSDSDLEAHVAKIAKKAGKRTVYVMDDDLANVPSYASSYYYYSLPSTHHNRKVVMENCDTFLTPSPVLMEKYGKPFNHKFLISEPSLNRITEKEKNEKVKIGFAGSIDRAQDINDILEGTIRKLVDKYGDRISIEFMGAKPSFIEELGLKYYPYEDGYDAYTAAMAKFNWDIGLAPMPQSDFHRCKYFNKYVEYASFGIVGVYSNVEPYVFGIRDNENGLLVENTTDEWFDAICRLIENEELRERLSKECLREANQVYALEMLASEYLEKATKDFEVKESPKIQSFSAVKKVFTVKRAWRKLVEKKLDFPKWFFEHMEKRKKLVEEKTELLNNTKKLAEYVKSNKVVFAIAPYELDIPNEYNRRVKLLDDSLKDDYYMVYINGEDRMLDTVRTFFMDERHALVSFNSYTTDQCEQVLDMINGGICVVHSVVRYMSDKLGIDMIKLFDQKDTLKIWDTHGAVPEKYHEASNFHTERITNEIEKVFYDKVDLIVVDSEDNRNHLKNKYGNMDDERIVILSKDGRNELTDRIEKKH